MCIYLLFYSELNKKLHTLLKMCTFRVQIKRMREGREGDRVGNKYYEKGRWLLQLEVQ